MRATGTLIDLAIAPLGIVECTVSQQVHSCCCLSCLDGRERLPTDDLLAAGSLIAGAVWSVALTPDGHRVLTASEDFTARVWDVVSGNCAHVLDGHTGWVVHVCTTPDGQRCATASHDGTARSVAAV